MGFAEIGTNLSNWATKIGDIGKTVADIATPVANLYGQYQTIRAGFETKPPKSSTGSAIVPGEIPPPSKSSTMQGPPVAPSSSFPVVPVAIGLGALLLVSSSGK